MSSKKKKTATKEDAKATLVPKLRFPEFRDTTGWTARTLGNFLVERNEYPQEPVPLFSLTIEDGVTPKTERYERAFLVKDSKDAYKLMLPEDFAFNPMNLRFGAIGRHSGSEAVAVSKYYNIFFCDRTADARFCEFYFRSDPMIAFYDNMAIGSLIEKRRVHFSDFLKFDIPFPSIPEQQKIAECLSSVDELMAAQGRKVDALKTRKKGLMQQLFPREGETQPRLRFPEFQNAGEWMTRSFSDLCDIKHGYAFESDFFNNEGDYVLLTPGNFYEQGGYRDRGDQQKYFTGEIPRDYVLAEGDMLVAMTEQAAGLLGSPILVPESDKFLHNQRLGLVTRKPGVVWLTKFFFHVFNTQAVRNAIHDTASGAKVRHTSPTKIGEVAVFVPNSLPEQQRIADCLTSLDDLIAAQTQKLEALKTHKKGLMQQLFPSPESG